MFLEIIWSCAFMYTNSPLSIVQQHGYAAEQCSHIELKFICSLFVLCMPRKRSVLEGSLLSSQSEQLKALIFYCMV